MATTRTRRRAAPRVPTSVVAPAPPAEPAPHNRPVTQSGLVPLSTRIPPDVKKRLKIAAATEELSEQDIVTEALSEWLQTRKAG